jgi:hypothetical protein
MSACDSTAAIQLGALEDAVFIEGWDRPGFTAGQKKKLIAFFHPSNAGNAHSRYVLLRGKVTPELREWVSDDSIFPWAPIQAIKLATNRATGSTGKIPGSFDICTEAGSKYDVPGDDVAKRPGPLYYLHGNYGQGNVSFQALRGTVPSFTIVCLPANRIDKFKRTFPHAKHVQDSLLAAYTAWWKGISEAQKVALSLVDRSRYALEEYKRLDASKIDDPEVKARIAVSSLDVTAILEKYRYYSRLLPGKIEALPLFSDPFDKYELADESSFRYPSNKDAIYRYLNTEYAWLSANGQTA